MLRYFQNTLREWGSVPDVYKRLAKNQGDPLFVSGAPRSGTTWFGKMLSCGGLWCLHEPFNPRNGYWSDWHTCIRGEQDALSGAALHLLDQCVEGDVRRCLVNPPILGKCSPWGLLPAPKRRRVLIKDPVINLSARWLAESRNLQGLILFRHPAACAVSLMRLKWPFVGLFDRFMREDVLELLPRSFPSLVERYGNQENLASAFLLYAAFISVQWRECEESSVLKPLFFETFANNPLDEFKALFSDLGLIYDQTVRDSHRRLCLGKHAEVEGPHNVQRNSARLVGLWKTYLKQEDEWLLQDIWSEFDLPLYKNWSNQKTEMDER